MKLIKLDNICYCDKSDTSESEKSYDIETKTLITSTQFNTPIIDTQFFLINVFNGGSISPGTGANAGSAVINSGTALAPFFFGFGIIQNTTHIPYVDTPIVVNYNIKFVTPVPLISQQIGYASDTIGSTILNIGYFYDTQFTLWENYGVFNSWQIILLTTNGGASTATLTVNGTPITIAIPAHTAGDIEFVASMLAKINFSLYFLIANLLPVSTLRISNTNPGVALSPWTISFAPVNQTASITELNPGQADITLQSIPLSKTILTKIPSFNPLVRNDYTLLIDRNITNLYINSIFIITITNNLKQYDINTLVVSVNAGAVGLSSPFNYYNLGLYYLTPPAITYSPFFSSTSSKTIAANVNTCLLELSALDIIPTGFISKKFFITGLSVSAEGTKSVIININEGISNRGNNTSTNHSTPAYFNQSQSLVMIDTGYTTFSSISTSQTFILQKADKLTLEKLKIPFDINKINISALSTGSSDIIVSVIWTEGTLV